MCRSQCAARLVFFLWWEGPLGYRLQTLCLSSRNEQRDLGRARFDDSGGKTSASRGTVCAGACGTRVICGCRGLIQKMDKSNQFALGLDAGRDNDGRLDPTPDGMAGSREAS